MGKNTVNPVYASLRLINGIVTIVLALPIYKIYNKTRKKFYLYWSIGYALYGISITLRIPAIESRQVTILGMLSYFMLLIGLIMIIAGIGDLVNRTKQFLVSTLVLPLVLIIMIITGRDWSEFGLFVALSPYIFITAALLYIRIKYELDITLLLAGWANILFLNIGYMYQYMNEGYVDLLSTLTKVVIFAGMTSPSFSFLYDELTMFLLGGTPVEYSNNGNQGFTMIDLNVKNREPEIKWIKDRIIKNSREGKRTVLISLYDQITSSDIIDDATRDNFYLIRMANGYRRNFTVFEEPVTSINEDIQLLDILIRDIIEFSDKNYVPCEIILYTLSQLIITHGARRMYSFITSKISELKSSQVSLTTFYSLDSHEKQAEIKMFERLADSVITH